MKKKRIVVFSGAGMSAESGLKTFRDSGGLWEEYKIEEVATPEAWRANPELVLNFYNLRRRQLEKVSPNAAHLALVKLESSFEVKIVTQNVDDLHERAGSGDVLHLHGELTKARSSINHEHIVDIAYGDIKIGQLAHDNSQLRPHIVWFGEAVPMLDYAAEIIREADFLLVVGTSLNVYPAAGLVQLSPSYCRKIIIDPKAEELSYGNFEAIPQSAVSGIPKIVADLLD